MAGFSSQSNRLTEDDMCHLDVAINKAENVLSAAQIGAEYQNPYLLTQEQVPAVSTYTIPEVTSLDMLDKTVIHRHYNDEYITEMSLLEIKTLENDLKENELEILRLKRADFQPGFMSDCVFNCFLKCFCELALVSSGYAHTLLVQNILSDVCDEETKEHLRQLFEKELENKQVMFIPMKFEYQPLVLVVVELDKKRSLVFNPLKLFDQDRLNYIKELLAVIYVGFSEFEIVQPKRKKHPDKELPAGISSEELHKQNFSSLMLCHYVYSFIFSGYDFVNEDIDFNATRERVYQIVAQGCFEQPTIPINLCRICEEMIDVNLPHETINCERCNQLYHQNCLNQLPEPVILDDRNEFVCPKFVRDIIHFENPQGVMIDDNLQILNGPHQFEFGPTGATLMETDVPENFDFQQLKNDQIISYPTVD